MNSLIKVNGIKKIENMQFHDIEGGFGEGKKAMLAKEIAQIHGKDIGRINEAINNNRKRFNNGIDVIDLKESPLVIDLIDKGIYTQNGVNRSSHIYLLSERGYSKLLKILEDDVAWEQYEKLVDGYFTLRGQALDTAQLSPELQMFKQIFDSVAKQQLEQQQIKAEIQETKEEIQGIRDIIEINPTAAWRKEVNRVLNAIGKKINNYNLPKQESYNALKDRAKCRPNVLIENLKKRAARNGMAPSKVAQLNMLDVLENDPRLREIYVAIVKDMAIKNEVRI